MYLIKSCPDGSLLLCMCSPHCLASCLSCLVFFLFARRHCERRAAIVLSEILIVVDSEELLPPDPFSPTLFISISLLLAEFEEPEPVSFLLTWLTVMRQKPIQRMSADVLEGNICAVFQWRGSRIRRLYLKADYFTAVWQKLSFQRLKLFFPNMMVVKQKEGDQDYVAGFGELLDVSTSIVN